MFDVSSQMERKNPLGAIRAFRKTSFRRDEATLVLKFTNPEYDREAIRQMYEEAADLNVVFLDGYIDRTDLWALLDLADCYISPHRSEGFGLTILEAMRLGKPVIATAYSGNMNFMTPENSFLLGYRLTPLTRDYGPYMRGAVWADPDVDEAARLMKTVVESPAEARDRGRVAQQQVERERHPSATGRVVRERLEAIRRS
jgi:glycosyltransferase involved in cell wall biosynthesis